MKLQHVAEAAHVFQKGGKIRMFLIHLGHIGDAVDVVQTTKQGVLP